MLVKFKPPGTFFYPDVYPVFTQTEIRVYLKQLNEVQRKYGRYLYVKFTDRPNADSNKYSVAYSEKCDDFQMMRHIAQPDDKFAQMFLNLFLTSYGESRLTEFAQVREVNDPVGHCRLIVHDLTKFENFLKAKQNSTNSQ